MSLVTAPKPAAMPRAVIILVSCIALCAFAYFQSQTVRQYNDGLIRGDSVQVFNTMLSRFAAGEGMIHVHSGNHFFKNHLMLWLYPAGWLYKLRDSLFTYLVPLNVALALAVIPLGLLAWRRLQNLPMVAAICILYTLSSLTASMLFSVHPESLVIPAWFLLFYGVEARNLPCIIGGFVGALLVKEDSALWLAVYFAWLLVFGKNSRRLAVAFLIASVVMMAVFRLWMAAIPLTGIDKDIGDFWLKRYGDVARTPFGLMVWFATHPLIILQRVVANSTWVFIIIGGGLICLLGWRELLLMIPPSILFFSATAEEFHHALYYYLYPFIPAAFLALIAGTQVLTTKFRQHRAAKSAVVGFLFFAAIVQLFVPTRVDGWTQLRPPLSLAQRMRVDIARDMVRRNVPRDVDMQAAVHYDLNQWVPQGRQLLFLRPRDIKIAGVVIVDSRRVSSDMDRDPYLDLLRDLWDPKGAWRVDEEADGLMVLRRK